MIKKNSTALSLALDESTDLQDQPQLAAFTHYVNFDLVVKEELLDLIALKESTRGVDIKNSLDTTLTNAEVPPNRHVSVATRGAISWGTRGTCPPTFFDGEDIICHVSPHVFFIGLYLERFEK